MWCESPQPLELARLLSDLLDRQTTVKELPRQTRRLTGPVTVFIDPEQAPAAVIVTDFEFAAYTGATLSLLPAGVAKEAITKKDLAGTLGENFGEVLNVLSSKLTKSPNRVVMRLPFAVSTEMPQDSKPIADKPARRTDFDVEIAGYGVGKMAIFMT